MHEDAAQITERIARDPRLQQEWLRQDNLIYGGLLAGSIAILQPFLTITTPDLTASVAVVSFAVAIPMLAALLMLNQQEVFRHRATGLRVVTVAKAIGQGLAVLGAAAALWHVLWIAGVGLLVSALVAVFVHAAGFSRLEIDPLTTKSR